LPAIGSFRRAAADGAEPERQTIPKAAESLLAKLHGRPTVLLLGELDTRYKHVPAIAAFETLWKKQLDVNLLVVARTDEAAGGMVEHATRHAEASKRLFVYDSMSPTLLQSLYPSMAALLAPSDSAGFGEALAKAAHYDVPLIACDFPLFRKLSGKLAEYFDPAVPSSLPDAVQACLDRQVDMGELDEMVGNPAPPWLDLARGVRQLLEGSVGGDRWEPWLPAQGERLPKEGRGPPVARLRGRSTDRVYRSGMDGLGGSAIAGE
jgi:glycosyltransferase involved in cell wall biosynthesis